MVAFLEKSTGSEGFHQVIDFLNRSHICYALTKKPDVYISFIKQFWRSAEATNDDNGEVQLLAIIEGKNTVSGLVEEQMSRGKVTFLVPIRLQKLVSRLAILVWMNKPDFDTMGLDDLYNNFKIVEQKVKKSAGARNDDKNLAFNVSTAIEWDILSENAEHPRVKTTEIGIRYDDLLVKLDDTGFKAATYKRGHKEYQMGLLRDEFEKVKQEKEGFEFKISKFDKSAKDLEQLLASQITNKSKKGFGYNVVPSPHPLILNRPTPLDLSYSGLEEFKQPEVNEYGPRDSSLKPTTGCDKESDNSKENTDDYFGTTSNNNTETSSKVRENNDAPIIEDWVSDDEDDDEPNPKVEKKTVIPTATKKEFVKPEKPVRRSVSCPNQQRKRIVSGNNYNKKDNDYYSKTSHSSAHKHMAPRAVLMKTGLKSVNTVRSVNTGRPFSTARARGFNAVKLSACWVWRPIKPNGASLVFNKYNYIDARVNTATPEDLVDLSLHQKTHTGELKKLHWGIFHNLMLFPTTHHTRIHKESPRLSMNCDVQSSVQTRRMKTSYFKKGFLSAIYEWVYRNKKDERGIVIRNKARLVFQGHTQEDGNTMIKSLAPVARIEVHNDCSWLMLPIMWIYGLPNGCKKCFPVLYGQIEEEVYVCQPPGFEDPDHPNKVYKVVKALYGLHQAPRAWYDTLANYLLCNGFERGKIDQTLFIKRHKGHILLVQIYVDDIIFGSTKKELCDEFEKLMKDKFQMSSMGELTFFLGLQVQQKKKGIFISQDKYVHEILRKFNYSDVKSASTPTDLEKPLVQDGDAADVDEHLYRSMIGSLMYLTASRPDIMFAVCACARFQVSPKSSHLLAVKRIFRYLKGKPSLGLWYSKDSPLELVAYTDSDYAGATQDRKSTTGGCQFLGNRLISWQCKKQTVVATSTTEAKYVAAASCCGQINTEHNVADLLTKGFDAVSTASSFYVSLLILLVPFNTAKQEKWLDYGFLGFELTLSGKAMKCEIGYSMMHSLRGGMLFVPQSVGFHTTQQMVISSPCLINNKELTSPEQTAPSKDFSNPLIVDSLLKTIWSSMHHVFTMKHWLVQSKRLLLDDQDGISSIPNSEIFEQLALMGYHTDSDKLTFQKGAFSPQWRFLIHNILHCLSPKKTAWEQFSSNIATAVICLTTNRNYNFSRMIFEHMVSNISSPHKFFMYPRFIQICLDMQRKQLQQHSKTYHVPSLSVKVFNNMKRPTKGYSGQEVALFLTMLDVTEPSTSPSKITSSPSHSPEPSPSSEPSTQHSPDHTTVAPKQPSPKQPSPT
ncbi:putative ribonuclease H-like domain-containing protein [Tanacetum coccineum]